MNNIHRVIHLSGGKDSGAMALFALELADRYGIGFDGLFCDTGNEHEITLEYLHEFAHRTGIKITRIKADFSANIGKRRLFVEQSDHYTTEVRQRVLAHLHPTGNPYLDLCLWKGRFPSATKRFCTVELKILAAREQNIDPLLDAGQIVESWQGIRAEESAYRAALPKRSVEDENLTIVRPLLRWPISKVLAIHRRHNIPLNPLYKLGMYRVGCMPCIMARKEELYQISMRFPHHINRILEWERMVSNVSKIGGSTLFHKSGMTDEVKNSRELIAQESGIDGMVRWSKTERGGKQYSLLKMLPPLSCQSEYGLCE
jgi:3'-phosphoadenosine 5'-phosphosulfate sulfotransferase (PAPS reductase)/FAD synthetase